MIQFNSTEKKILEAFKRHGVSMSRCMHMPRLNNTARLWDPIDRERMGIALFTLINKGILKPNKAGYIITDNWSKYLHNTERTQYPGSI